MNCQICETTMNKKNNWLFDCPNCGFAHAKLEQGAGRGVDGIEDLRKSNFDLIISSIQEAMALEGKKCLEVGPAEGWFLEKLKSKKAVTTGIEASEQALELQKRSFDVIHGFFPEAIRDSEKFNLIVFNDVFEHLPDPVSAIKACESHLEEDGILLLNIPNKKGVFYRLASFLYRFGVEEPLNRMWQKDFPSPHLLYFSDENMTSFVEKYTGLKQFKSFFLPSITFQGLFKRISNSYSGPKGLIVYLIILLSLPLMSLLPKDIMVFMYKKSA